MSIVKYALASWVACQAIPVSAEYNAKETLVLADCGIGSNAAHPDWATSNQMLYCK